MKEAEIIPDVLEAFAPKVDIAVHWPDATARLGNLISPGELHDAPKVHLTAVKAAYHHDLKGQQLTLALSDPDAPSRDNPKWSEVCHWLITSLPLHSPSSPSSLAEDLVAEMAKATDLVEYKPPGPPEKTGKHRYVLVLMAPKNGTKAGLDLEAPSGRQHWGFESHQRRVGVGRWMREMGLEVVGKSRTGLFASV